MAQDLWANVSLIDIMEEVRTTKLEGSSLALYEGAHVPANGDVLATYTAIETTFGGYARVTLNGWSASAIVSNVAQTNSPFATFTPSGAPGVHTVTGYFIILSDGQLGPAGRLAGAITIAASTPFIIVLQEGALSP